MYPLITRLSLILISLAVLNLAGCASSASREGMLIQDLSINKKYPNSIVVETKGGSETGAMDSTNISNDDFKAAIEDAITKTGLFKKIVQGKNGDYDLTVTITQISKPILGFNMTVELETAWSLVKTLDKSVAMRKVIKAAYTATMGDSLVGVRRLRLAVEAVARENITQGLKAISEL
jgi:hypothetical protein